MLISFWVHRRASAGKLQELEPPLTGNFLKRTFGRFIFACACFATLIAAFSAVENWRGKRAFHNYKREVEAKGEILDWRRVLPPPVPVTQNLAESSIFKGLLDYERRPTGTVWGNTNNTARLERLVHMISGEVRTKSRHSENLDKNELINFTAYQE